MNTSYGIDFGTTNSTIATVGQNQKIVTLPIDAKSDNAKVMRSITYVSKDGKFLYGKAAIDAYLLDVAEGKGKTKKTMYTGRFITVTGDADIHGVRPDEVVEELIEFDEFDGGRMLQALKSVLSSEAIKTINLFGNVTPLEEVVAGFLKEMKTRADAHSHHSVDSVVLGRPVEYVGGNNKLALTRMGKAAKLAGFKNIEFEYEPIAASLDYARKSNKKETVAIFDFGGGTLDISIIRFPEKRILANVGLPIGGDFFNSKIFKYKLAKFFGSETKHGVHQLPMPSYIYVNLRDWYRATLLKSKEFDERLDSLQFMNTDENAIIALRSLVNNNLGFSLYETIDKTKRNLSNKEEEPFSFTQKDIDIVTQITKYEFEEYIQEDVVRISELIDEALKVAQIKASDVDAVATTGGSSLIPLVRELLNKKFGKEKIIPSDTFTSVASGLAIRASEIFS